MAVERRFLIAPSFARLLRRESRHTSRITEGHFHSQADECRFIRVEREQAVLVLARRGEDGMRLEDVAAIPYRQAEALMDVAAGMAAFVRMIVPIGSGRVGVLDHFLMPGSLDVLTMPVEDLSEPPDWFNAEITHRPEFGTSSLALNGCPNFREVEITIRALEELLDTLESQNPSSAASGGPAPSEPEPVALPNPRAAVTELAPETEGHTFVTSRQQATKPAPRLVSNGATSRPSTCAPSSERRGVRSSGRVPVMTRERHGWRRLLRLTRPHFTRPECSQRA